MSVNRIPGTTRIGLVTDEPIRLEGLFTIFDQSAESGGTRYVPITGSLEELLSNPDLECLIVDRSTPSVGLGIQQTIRRARPGIRQIVIGPPGNDELMQQAIIAGARAYLDLTADPEMVLKAIEEVMSGSIWAPRRVLSRLIDRLLTVSDSSIAHGDVHLTDREKQVLDLILLARSNREIAGQLGIEERTVKAHVGRLMRKTGADNRIELSMRALNAPKNPGMIDRRQEDRRPADRRQGDRRNGDSRPNRITHG
ncbi:MAG: response regulator transcription factor [Terracidiphilus sp.]|jgi:DNA-binding NarL/FixJ family response regulator